MTDKSKKNPQGNKDNYSEAVSPLHAKPSSLSDLPGLGPIRLRALQKAGYDSLFKLKAANQQALEQVPGITSIKAYQIKSMLEPFKFIKDNPKSEEKKSVDNQAKNDSAKNETSDKSGASAKSTPSGQKYPSEEITMLMQATARLLFRHDRSTLRGRLQNQIERLIQLPGVWDTVWPHLDSKVKEEWPDYIVKLCRQMDKLKKDRKLNRQQQGELADAIMIATLDPNGDQSSDEDEG